MRRALLLSPSFTRAVRRLLKKQPQIAQTMQTVLSLLEADAFRPQLKTHKLKGDLQNSWSCSVTYNLRIVFEFVDHAGQEAILLQSIGTHDEVY